MDSSSTLPTNSHSPDPLQKSDRRNAHNPKTNIVVQVVGIVVAIRRTTVFRVVVPGTTTDLASAKNC